MLKAPMPTTWPMLKSLFLKELRDLLPLIAIAIAVEGYLFGIMFRFSRSVEMRDPRTIWPFLYMLGVLFPVVAGLWQVGRESFGNHYQFLLHRPLRREVLLGAKLLIGAAICVVFIDLPILCFADWGDHELRYSAGWLSEMAWPLCVNMLLLYLGAFLSMLRPGRWYASQFLPLLAGIMLFVVLQVVGEISSWWWSMSFRVTPLFAICYVLAVLHVARTRDYS